MYWMLSSAILTVVAVVLNAEVPLSIIKEAIKFHSARDFVQTMVNQDGLTAQQRNEIETVLNQKPIPSLPSGRNTEASINEDICLPAKKAVAVTKKDKLPNQILYPMCLKVEQCAGCCGHESMACQPLVTEKVDKYVMIINYTEGCIGSHCLKYAGLHEPKIERHVQCQCQCIEKEQHCDMSVHFYDQSACKCKCKNPPNCNSAQGYVADDRTCKCISNVAVFNAPSAAEARDDRIKPNQASSNDCSQCVCRRSFSPVFVDGQCKCKHSRRNRHERCGSRTAPRRTG